MNHPTDDELLLLVYDELPAARAAEVEAHLLTCAACDERWAPMARGRVATDWAVERRRERRAMKLKVGAAGLAAAAAIAAVLLIGRRDNQDPRGVWPKQIEWSANAGYFAGGPNVIAIDGQLTRLEQGWSYGRP
jgi:anti-sigma factor RsiW